jgi:uncharacterized membrane protein YqgA involved in biofilm formation
MFVGFGTLVNICTIVIGSIVGVAVGDKLNIKVREAMTNSLGLITGMVAVLTASDITNPSLKESLGPGRPVLIVLVSLVVGSALGTLWRIEDRLEAAGDKLKARFSAGHESQFTEGFVAASLLFCVGALAILGPIREGLGQGSDILLLKAALDGIAGAAFASVFGWGVMASAISVGVYQGAFTVLGVVAGQVLSDTQILMMNATGGLMLVGISLRLLDIKQVPVGNMIPGLAVAPILVALIGG